MMNKRMNLVGFQNTTNDYPLFNITSQEQKLWMSVLTRAIFDYFQRLELSQPLSEIRRIRRETRKFFMSNDTEVGDFVWICETISDCPQELIDKIRFNVRTNKKPIELSRDKKGKVANSLFTRE